MYEHIAYATIYPCFLSQLVVFQAVLPFLFRFIPVKVQHVYLVIVWNEDGEEKSPKEWTLRMFVRDSEWPRRCTA